MFEVIKVLKAYQIHAKTFQDGGTKVCSNGPVHMTKMATMPINDKTTF